MAINKDIMRERKRAYGDNFSAIAKKWSDRLFNKLWICPNSRFEITEKEVAELMALMKEARIEAIEEKIKENRLNGGNEFEYYDALHDNRIDKENYEWIAQNFEEYKRL